MQQLEWILGVDRKFLLWINGQAGNAYLDGLMLFISGRWLWITGLSFYLIWIILSKRFERIRVLVWIALTVGFCDVLAHFILKPWFGRIRPCKSDDLVRVVDGCAGLFSFPSNHASNVAVFASLWLCFYGAKQGRLAMAMAFFVGISRAYLGVHYPGDVLGGFAYGTILGLLSFSLMGRWLCDTREKKSHPEIGEKSEHV